MNVADKAQLLACSGRAKRRLIIAQDFDVLQFFKTPVES